MANSRSWDGLPKDVEPTVAAEIITNSDKEGANQHTGDHIRFVRRGEAAPEASSAQETIAGYDAELMSDRTLLTAEEEKKLLRKIDWRLMTLCSLIFMFKNLDSQNVGIPHQECRLERQWLMCLDIERENHESRNRPEHHHAVRDDSRRVQSDYSSLLCKSPTERQAKSLELQLIIYTGTIYCGRSTVKSSAEILHPFKVAVQNYDWMGYISYVSCSSHKQRWFICNSLSVGSG